MFPQTIDGATQRVLAKIAQSGLAADFYLAGGTALALQLGHRQSIDLDWFSAKALNNDVLKSKLAKLGDFELASEDKNTIHGSLRGVKVSFLNYPYGLLFPLVDFGNVQLADERDIAAMKIDAVSARGSRKDFIDIYFLLRKYSLSELVGFFEKKYAGLNYNKLHIIKSLGFFADAEKEPLPVMLEAAKWDEVKKRILEETGKVLENK